MADNIWISAKVGAITLTIGGSDPANFQDNCMSVLGPDSFDTIGELFAAAFLAGAETALHAQAQDAVISAGMNKPADAVTTPAVPATQAENGIREETDKWGSVWTYNVPGAPSCPHGPRVQKKATSQAGKPYTAWCCPTTSPFAYRQKIQKADCKMEFAK